MRPLKKHINVFTDAYRFVSCSLFHSNLIMRPALLLAFLLQSGAFCFAQCPDFQLSDLHSLQKADSAGKESWLLSHGFDLAAKSGHSLRYNKCWMHYHGRAAVYNQVIYWNTVSGDITYLTPDESAFQALRQFIEGRHGQTGSIGMSDMYVGQMFKYKFGSQWLDGVMHWSVAISYK